MTSWFKSTNEISSNLLGNDDCAIATKIRLTEPAVLLKVRLALGYETMANSAIQLQVCDTSGFTYNGGFPNILYTSPKIYIDNSDLASLSVEIPVGTIDTPYLELQGQDYYIVARLFTFGGTQQISLLNDASVKQTENTSLMYDVNEGRWFLGFSNSRLLNSMCINTVFSQAGVAISENRISENLFTFWSRDNEKLFLRSMSLKSNCEITVFDQSGNILHELKNNFETNSEVEIHTNEFPNGVYIVNVRNHGNTVSFKIPIIR
jgi:hypothetical protein